MHTGTATNAKSKKAHGHCEGVTVDGLTEFETLPSTLRHLERASLSNYAIPVPSRIASPLTGQSFLRSNQK